MIKRTVTLAELGLPAQLPLPKRQDWGIGMVGYGGFGAGSHAPAYRQLGWNIVAVCDPSPQAQTRAREDGVPFITGELEEFLHHPGLEVVDLQTQPNLRPAIVTAAAACGLPIATAKPLGLSWDDCQSLAATARSHGTRFSVHQNYRWMPAPYAARALVDAGLLGTLHHASIEHFGDQDRSLAGHPYYSVVEDFITVQWNNHFVDLLRFWTGHDAHRVWTRTGRAANQNFVGDNLLHSLHDFGPGLTGHIIHSELLRSGLQGSVCRLDGDLGSVTFGIWDRTLHLQCEATGPDPVELDVSPLARVESVAASMANLLIALEEGHEPMVTADGNLPTMATVFAEYTSAQRGGEWVAVGA